MTKYIHPDEVLNIYYKISDIPDILEVTKDNEDVTNNLDDIQNMKKIQWSPDEMTIYMKHLNSI